MCGAWLLVSAHLQTDLRASNLSHVRAIATSRSLNTTGQSTSLDYFILMKAWTKKVVSIHTQTFAAKLQHTRDSA